MPGTPRFTFGAATSAYQIEGGRGEGGKGDSIWDRFSDEGRLADPGDVAIDHYHRFAEDVALMADLGIDAYRFSIAWTRIQPGGRGTPNREGVAFYRRLLDALDAAEIEPWVTMYHWDLPVALQDEGGWVSRSTAEAFADYAAVLVDLFGDRVHRWITINEPWVAAMLGHVDGVFAPGLTDWPSGLAAGHHLLLAHGLAVDAVRAGGGDAQVGIALDCRPCRPASDAPADQAAARHFDGYRNRWFFDPVFGKGYPEDMVAAYGAAGRIPDGHPVVDPGADLDIISRPIDFLGVNYYTSLDVTPDVAENERAEPFPDPPPDHTEMGWKITPRALTDFLVRVDETWAPQRIVITENGASYSDGPDDDGTIDDGRRIDYLRSHLDAVAAARRAGVPVDGYFVWSMFDNLEWLAGFGQRFGLVWVDTDTQQRIPKASFDWYRSRMAAGIGD